RYIAAFFICLLVCQQQILALPLSQASPSSYRAQVRGLAHPNSNQQSFDLSSSQTLFPASSLFSNSAATSVNISAGRMVQTIHPSDILTAGQYAAASQVLAGGVQTLKINVLGRVISGTLNLSSAMPLNGIANLVIPHGVVAIDNFTTVPLMQV